MLPEDGRWCVCMCVFVSNRHQSRFRKFLSPSLPIFFLALVAFSFCFVGENFVPSETQVPSSLSKQKSTRSAALPVNLFTEL